MSPWRIFYSGLLYALTPLALARLWWKGRVNPAYRQRWAERLGWIPRFPVKPRLWVHAVSVGEVIAASPLIRAWQAAHPEWAVLVTTTTPTGSAQLRRNFADTVEHVYLPLDLPDAVQRFLTRTRPCLGVIMETELWPNLIVQAKRQHVPLLLANARLSPRSVRGYAKLRPLVAETLQALAWIAARDAEDVQRFLSLGADATRTEAAGNLKFDLEISPQVMERGEHWRTLLGAERLIWIAASTHAGEEAQVLAAHRSVLQQRPDAMLLLAPRHPERALDVARQFQEAGLSYVRRSALAKDSANDARHAHVLLIDTLGELMDFYAASDVALVGGSLVPQGGHNPLEPLALGVPVIYGSAVFNFAEVYAAMQQAGIGWQIDDASSLAERVLQASKAREEQSQRGQAFLHAHRGALQRVLARLESLSP